MKKVLLSTIILTAFSCSLILFQLSCKKVAVAASDQTTTTQVGKLIYSKLIAPATGNSYFELWSANYDGTNQQKISITLPAGVSISGDAKLSPDHKTLFFGAYTFKSGVITKSALYACNIDGSNPHEIVSGTQNESFEANVAY
ncbi:hypothetical protein SAMN05192574_11537 [Mucilaginibacter gossypiicola]|uniref:Uncharacterized protein n=1 Tax=Mucilaginibacter gossypiicola TaxID=551995 RepID=A0A1H8TBU9_9SPHI|nr:hypothetical protein [Mucilaginibacter gossypiicola]SEO88295.1 hypothetical protein SAMN05192574_11537 [Mucilaginibacter gossypiicola]